MDGRNLPVHRVSSFAAGGSWDNFAEFRRLAHRRRPRTWAITIASERDLSSRGFDEDVHLLADERGGRRPFDAVQRLQHTRIDSFRRVAGE
jgi:hypothetical protein